MPIKRLQCHILAACQSRGCGCLRGRYRRQAQEIVNLNKRQAAVYGISACLTNMLYYFLVSRPRPLPLPLGGPKTATGILLRGPQLMFLHLPD